MAAVSERLEGKLRSIFGDRMRTDRVERKMYSFDIGAMPKLVKPFTAAGVAGAVVRPDNEEQIVELVKLPRAKASTWSRVPGRPRATVECSRALGPSS